MGQSSNPVSVYDAIHENAVDFSGAAGSLAARADTGTEQARYFPVGRSARMEHVRRRIEEVAASLVPVMITGEPGVGKEWVARYVHALSPRRDQPFVLVDCAEISADRLESELFGFESGRGRIDAAQGGTLFLDEVARMSSLLLSKLQGALRQRSYQRVGSNRSRPCDVRLVTATSGAANLVYGTHVTHIEIPPLRERVEDISDLADNMMARAEEFGLETIQLTPGAARILKHHDWPGNIRELASLMERLSLLYPGRQVDIPDLPLEFTERVPLRLADRAGVAATRVAGPQPQDIDLPAGRIPLKRYLEDIEIALIRRALHETNGIIAHAAKYLHLRRTTLAEKIKRYGLGVNENADLNAER